MGTIVQAQLQSDYNDISFVDLNFKINGGFDLKSKTTTSQITDATVDLSFFPREELNQEVLNLNVNSKPAGRVSQRPDGIEYSWSNPSLGRYNFYLDSNVRVRNALITVDKKIKFPLEGQDTYFTKPTEFIDINNDIKSKAQEIVSGEDDLYIATFKIGQWVQSNVKYDLGTLTAEVVQKSSWVFENKDGVCDEITNLFISMMRSVGVPARYVSGLAYTNINEKWGPHAWAEVYFPNYGWVPFDITYGQMGWIDPTHIKISTSVDSGNSAVRYSWKSSEIDFEADKLDVSASLLKTGAKISPQDRISIKPLVNNVGPGSYVPVEVEIENTNDYYLPSIIIFKKSPELVEKNYRSILINPRQTSREYWLVKIPNNIEKNFIYYSALEVSDSFHNNFSSEISYSSEGKDLSLDEANKIIESKNIKEEKKEAYGVLISCDSPETIYFYEDIDITCTLFNKGQKYLIDSDICLKENCFHLDSLGINEKKEFLFKVDNPEKGSGSYLVSVKNKDLQRELEAFDVVTTDVIDDPGVDITSVDYNINPDYNDDMKLEMLISLKLPVNDLRIYINDAKVFTTDKLERSRGLVISAKGKSFAGDNELDIEINFKDKNGKEYAKKKTYPIEVKNVPLYIKFLSLLHII